MVFTLSRLYATYLKQHPETGFIYVGRTSGWVKIANIFSARKIVARRDKNHHRNKDGYGKAELDQFSINRHAIRGREEMLINKFKEEGISGNVYRGISPRNKKRKLYLSTALRVFGDVMILILLWYAFF